MDLRKITRRNFIKSAALFAGAAAVNPVNILKFKPVGNLTIMWNSDSHAHLKPVLYREPSVNIGPRAMNGRPGHLVGDSFNLYYDINPGSAMGYFCSYVDFVKYAKQYGPMGGYAHMAAVFNKIREERYGKTIMLDTGDSWQGTGIALLTKGKAVCRVQNAMGYDAMTGHWEFTYGKKQLLENIKSLNFPFIAQNVTNATWGGLIFKPYIIKEVNGLRVGIIGQAFPYVPLAHPAHFVKNWDFGINTHHAQKMVNKLKNEEKVDLVVVLSHNGLEVDRKFAALINGIDIIVGGHTHDILPAPEIINNTIIVQAGTHGKFVGRIDLNVQNKKIVDYDHKLIPIVTNWIKPDPEISRLIDEEYAPYEHILNEKLGTTEDLLYRRATFTSTVDNVVEQAFMEKYDTPLVFTPGWRWGETILPGEHITMEHVYGEYGTTYPEVYRVKLSGQKILETTSSNLSDVFARDPYLQMGGDATRISNSKMHILINQHGAKRIKSFMINGKPINPNKDYWLITSGAKMQKLSNMVGGGLQKEKAYDVIADYIREHKTIRSIKTGEVIYRHSRTAG
ncbi:MAG: thiosulfohydrolase SoxB [Deltaproteobacteria bacterium]|jgi:sulfur-oxidizing protein SoxB|nr:thiosulfohydrolase SoxB [Deltaproteobacteria bacterium]MCL5880194.1 thiosulfohydrolase SoxB [Deltaproteobacteria bacterium]MDA8304756.1 thiosulfohydrolase SoxB [Deltaproteobacteria bacterium]